MLPSLRSEGYFLGRRAFLILIAVLVYASTSRVISRTETKTVRTPSSQLSLLPTFSDITFPTGITFKNEACHTKQKFLIETMGGGVAMFDYNGDGHLDLFFVNGAALTDSTDSGKAPDKSNPRHWNRLYRNNGDGTFTDVTEKAGVRGHHYGMGVAVGDYDNDGRPDLYVTNFGENLLYHNNGDGTFTDVTKKAGVGGGGWSSSACFVDYDRDGRLDLIVARYLEWDFEPNPWCGERRAGYRAYCHPDNFRAVTHLIYRNNGDGTFTDASERSGFAAAPGKGLGIAFNDFDRDGWPDIVVANDMAPQQFFKNNRDGSFTEMGLLRGMAYDGNGRLFAGMGLDCQDYDNDSWPDVFINNLPNQTYALYRNVKGAFDYVTGPSGIASITTRYSGWGTKFIDYDNDGWKDLFVAQGHVMDTVELTQPELRYLQPLLLMRNVKGRFVDVSPQSGAPFQVPRSGRGAAFGDLDNDGDVDVAINFNNQKAVILRNEGQKGHHWLLVNTVGTVSNRDGICAELRLITESGFEQHAMVSTAGSYMSASDKRVHFGLGADKIVRVLEITWPSGVVQRLENIQANQILNIQEPKTARVADGQE